MPPRPVSLALCLLLLGAPVRAETAATGVEQTGQRTALPERSEVDARALERQLNNEEQQRLQTDSEAFLALWLPANAGKPHGAVILLPGDQESADWPRSVGPLRRELPDTGWHSLSLTLPDPATSPPTQPSAATDAARTAPASPAPVEAVTTEALGSAEPPREPTPTGSETVSLAETSSQAHSARVLLRIDAAVAFAQERQADTIVLLGHGSGAYWAARYLAERKPANIQHLLLLAPTRPEGFLPKLDELVPGLQLATGDFFYRNQANDREAAHERLQASKRLSHPAYTQIALYALPGNPATEQKQVFRRIRGWLEQHLPAGAAPMGTAQ
ncbi:alpha/beta hydrolase family protein [Pseudomonas benzenivorans]|uniref:Alpha/beta hydrolase family protein n=1 Tax=Pseudomonas benzenivorans TaxID=556533 RepID=A0ABY5H2A8_9PSED|nr:alpha/beta hydrolase family protein [Pseudomonas benzenivorans]UTW06418.1 alpha/beta hydrolase family protein [Pseudomonas benzenivorans]